VKGGNVAVIRSRIPHFFKGNQDWILQAKELASERQQSHVARPKAIGISAPEAVKTPPAGLLSQSQNIDDETLARQALVKPILVAEALVLGESDFFWILWLFCIHRYNPTNSSWSSSQKSLLSGESFELPHICGAK